MALVLIFSHTADAAEYGGWRLLNTLLGIAIGASVSRLAWPIRGRDEIENSIVRTRAATVATLRALAQKQPAAPLLRLQDELLDSISSLRTARKNGRLEQRIDCRTDLLTARALPAVRAAIATLSASAMLDELAHSGVSAGCIETVRAAVAALAVREAPEACAETQAGPDFPVRYGQALGELARIETHGEAHLLLAALLGEIQRAADALDAMRAPGRDRPR